MKTYLGLDRGCLATWLGATAVAYLLPPYCALDETLFSLAFTLPAMWLVVYWFHKRGCPY